MPECNYFARLPAFRPIFRKTIAHTHLFYDLPILQAKQLHIRTYSAKSAVYPKNAAASPTPAPFRLVAAFNPFCLSFSHLGFPYPIAALPFARVYLLLVIFPLLAHLGCVFFSAIHLSRRSTPHKLPPAPERYRISSFGLRRLVYRPTRSRTTQPGSIRLAFRRSRRLEARGPRHSRSLLHGRSPGCRSPFG